MPGFVHALIKDDNTCAACLYESAKSAYWFGGANPFENSNITSGFGITSTIGHSFMWLLSMARLIHISRFPVEHLLPLFDVTKRYPADQKLFMFATAQSFNTRPVYPFQDNSARIFLHVLGEEYVLAITPVHGTQFFLFNGEGLMNPERFEPMDILEADMIVGRIARVGRVVNVSLADVSE
jgi:hypothetical protein